MIKILSGKEPAESLMDRTKLMASACIKKPTLAIILVEGNEASERYVRNKSKDAEKCGCEALVLRMPQTSTEEQVKEMVMEANRDNGVDGIIVQLPLPEQINEQEVLNTIDPKKDVDGLTAYNKHRLYSDTDSPLFLPCTPEGIIYLLDYYDIPLAGANTVVVGRSELVGKPVAQLLMRRNATIQICHSKSNEVAMKDMMKFQDIIVLAAGSPHLIKRDVLGKSPVVIDVGINFEEGKMCGDFDSRNLCEEDCISYTPVPGGIGLMTRAVLMNHVVKACLRKGCK